MGTASSPLLRVPLESLAIHHTPTAAKPDTSPITRNTDNLDSPDEPPDDFIGRLDDRQRDGSIRPIVYISRATLANEQNWTPLKLEAGYIV